MSFGKPAIRPTELATIMATRVVPLARRIERRNLTRLEDVDDTPKRRALRTKAIQILLRREGKHRGFQTFPDKDKRLTKPRGEWLYDVIWWNERNGHKGVKLAVESEWNANKDDIIDDFEKLLSIKSSLKMMIYRVRRNDQGHVREAMKNCFLSFGQHVHGENYILCEFQPGWTCNCYLYRVKRDRYGKVADVKYRTLFEC